MKATVILARLPSQDGPETKFQTIASYSQFEKSNCLEGYYGTMHNYFQSNDKVSAFPYAVGD